MKLLRPPLALALEALALRGERVAQRAADTDALHLAQARAPPATRR